MRRGSPPLPPCSALPGDPLGSLKRSGSGRPSAQCRGASSGSGGASEQRPALSLRAASD